MRICVYCAANDKISGIYKAMMKELGNQIARRGHTLVYGGGACGLMGAVARGAIEAGGEVIGVVPDFMNQWEPIQENATIIHTLDMGTRKTIMEDNSDGFIIAPGGIGTLDELFQALTLKELGQNPKPMVLYNIDGFYNVLDDFFRLAVEKNAIRSNVATMIDVINADVNESYEESAIKAVKYFEEHCDPEKLL